MSMLNLCCKKRVCNTKKTYNSEGGSDKMWPQYLELKICTITLKKAVVVAVGGWGWGGPQ